MAGQSAALSAIPPPSANVINLAIASIIIHAILLPFVAWTTWKHGKRGMVCWPIFLSFFLFRFLSNGWQLRVRNEPDIPNAVSIFTNAGIFDCLLLTLLGITYEA